MGWELELRVLSEVALAMLLGAIVGFEREMAQRPAGLRTHILVAGAAALLVGLGDAFMWRFGASYNETRYSFDPIRIIEAIIAGVSFIGAGTIIRHRDDNTIEGLTTAASVLFAAALGVSVALRQFVIAIGGTFLVLLVVYGGNVVKRRLVQTARSDADRHEA